MIKDINDGNFDMLIDENSKFIFYHFNNYLSPINEPLKLIRYAIVSDNTLALGA